VSEIEVSINTQRCQAYGACVKAAPNVFVLPAAEKAQVRADHDVSDEEVLAAAKKCPYRAVTVTRRSTGEQLYPPPRKVIK
jgi:ferredoxin